MVKKKIHKSSKKHNSNSKKSHSRKKKLSLSKNIKTIFIGLIIIIVILSVTLFKDEIIEDQNSIMKLEVEIFTDCLEEERSIIGSSTSYDDTIPGILVIATLSNNADEDVAKKCYEISKCISKIKYPPTIEPNIQVEFKQNEQTVGKCYTPKENQPKLKHDELTFESWVDFFEK
jgi:hypothetical protein